MIVEIVVEATQDLMLPGDGIFPFMTGAGLPESIAELIQHVRYPAVTVIESEVQGVYSVRPVAESHSGAVVIGNVVLEGNPPSVASPAEAETLRTAVVAQYIYLVAFGGTACGRCATPGRDSEIIVESQRHFSEIGALPSPDCVMVEGKREVEPAEAQHKAQLHIVDERSGNIAFIQSGIVAISSVDEEMATGKGNFQGRKGKRRAGQGTGIAAPDKVSACR